ncbi:MAG TPA: aspartyl/asparaginyl beta-hydroxylase domain-containing protein [Gallionellaceae bacterium]|nr:aspartyl/asparaginyl beta-hydroxylase domain-containing protein [Gallionellaceae bacterium]
MSALYDAGAGALRWLYDRRISAPAVLDPAFDFPAAGEVAARWKALRAEAEQVAAALERVPRFHDLMPAQAPISANDHRDWRLFVLKAYGADVSDNMARCPVLAALLASHSDILSAAFSFLAPNKHIPLHRGPFRGVTRFYMGLSVPMLADGLPAAVLTIDGRDHRIGDGEYLLWDDTYPHEVWNRSDRMRIALLLDVRRRGMPTDMALLSHMIVAAAGLAIRIKGVKWQV